VSAPGGTAAVEAVALAHTYRRADVGVPALRGLTVRIGTGETVAVLGPSGSGKSTLLALLAGLVPPTGGHLSVLGRDVGTAGRAQLQAMRARDVGVLLQDPGRNLLGYGSVADNLMFAQRGSGRGRAERRRRVSPLLGEVGLEGREHAAASSLSGGEQQRLAVAVAVANGPRLLLADEPTSSLDESTGHRVVALLRDLRDRHGTTVVAVTHDPEVAADLDRTLTLADGELVGDERSA
jgi:putative ABC transport system ATP-binding protein